MHLNHPLADIGSIEDLASATPRPTPRPAVQKSFQFHTNTDSPNTHRDPFTTERLLAILRRAGMFGPASQETLNRIAGLQIPVTDPAPSAVKAAVKAPPKRAKRKPGRPAGTQHNREVAEFFAAQGFYLKSVMASAANRVVNMLSGTVAMPADYGARSINDTSVWGPTRPLSVVQPYVERHFQLFVNAEQAFRVYRYQDPIVQLSGGAYVATHVILQLLFGGGDPLKATSFLSVVFDGTGNEAEQQLTLDLNACLTRATQDRDPAKRRRQPAWFGLLAATLLIQLALAELRGVSPRYQRHTFPKLADHISRQGLEGLVI